MVALWAWQCVIAAVLLCCALSMTFSAAAAWRAVGGQVFAAAPRAVVEAYALGTAALGADHRVVHWRARAVERGDAGCGRSYGPAPGAGRAAPNCGYGSRCCPGSSRLRPARGLEGERPDAWWLPGTPPRLVVTTAALRR
ncbi:hypothetical protein GCM10023238_31640 [Streptomyces heliomycini]